MEYSRSNANPKVCIMLPVYNGEKTLKYALSSLINQTYTNWICIIVNDGSKDGTISILNSLSDPRFQIIHLSVNRGRGFARQVALENAKGDYLTYLDADDFLHCDKLRIQVEYLNQHTDIDLIGSAVITFNSSLIPTTYRNHSRPYPIRHQIGKPLYLSMATAMIRLSKTENIRYNLNLNASEDIDYISRYLANNIYVSLNSAYYYYHVSEETTSYLKMLEYTWNEILRGVYTMRTHLLIACKITLKSSVKLLIYACCIPFLGVDFFLRKRGKSIPSEEIRIFNEQLHKLSSDI